MGKYIIRAFFDAGGLSCLWSGSDDAEAEWGYNIIVENSPVSHDLKALIVSAQNDFEIMIDYGSWRAKAGKEEECFQLNNKCREIINRLDDELGDEVKIVDELKVECSNPPAGAGPVKPLATLPGNFWLWFVLFFSIIGGLIILFYGFRSGIGGTVVRDVNLRVLVGSYVLLPGVIVLIIYAVLKRNIILEKIFGKGRKG